MDAYQILSHPSKRIDYDVKLRMFRRGDFDPKEKVKVNREKKGAFLTLEKEPKIEVKEPSATDKANELIQDYYKDNKADPSFLNKQNFQEHFEHSVKHKVFITVKLR